MRYTSYAQNERQQKPSQNQYHQPDVFGVWYRAVTHGRKEVLLPIQVSGIRHCAGILQYLRSSSETTGAIVTWSAGKESLPNQHPPMLRSRRARRRSPRLHSACGVQGNQEARCDVGGIPYSGACGS